MQQRELSFRTLLEQVLPVEHLPRSLQAEVAIALEQGDPHRLEQTAYRALTKLGTLGLVRAAEETGSGQRYLNLLTGEFISVRAPEPAAGEITKVPMPVVDGTTTSTMEITREMVALASRLLKDSGDQLAENEQLIDLLVSYGRQVLECDDVRYVPLRDNGEAGTPVPGEAQDSPFTAAMAERLALRRRQILTIADSGDTTPAGAFRSFAAVPLLGASATQHGYIEARSVRPAHFTRARLALLELLAETGGELLRNSAHLQKLVFIDSRTQIFNKSFFDIELAQFLARARREGRQVALAIADVDDFKSFNSRYGYQGGDQVLHRVAQLLKSHVRPFDIVARWGGEEFAILLAPPVELENAMNICDRLRQAVQQSTLRVTDLHGRDHRASVTVSVGGALYPQDGQSADELWRRANEALLAAKAAGKNLVRFRQPPRREARPA